MIHKILADFGRFLLILSLNISIMAENFSPWSFASTVYPFYLPSDQVSSNSAKQLAKKCPKTIQKMHENWPFSSQFFSLKTKSRQKSDATSGKENLSQIPNIKSDFRQHFRFWRYSTIFRHHFLPFLAKISTLWMNISRTGFLLNMRFSQAVHRHFVLSFSIKKRWKFMARFPENVEKPLKNVHFCTLWMTQFFF